MLRDLSLSWTHVYYIVTDFIATTDERYMALTDTQTYIYIHITRQHKHIYQVH